MSTVTVPENKLAELQIKASQRDELLEALEELYFESCYGEEASETAIKEIMARVDNIKQAIAKAKGE